MTLLHRTPYTKEGPLEEIVYLIQSAEVSMRNTREKDTMGETEKTWWIVAKVTVSIKDAAYYIWLPPVFGRRHPHDELGSE